MSKLTLKENITNSSIEIIRYDWPDIFYGLKKIEFTEMIKKRLLNRVIEAYYFGSVATNTFSPRSDVDLILITDSARPFISRPLDFSDLDTLAPRLDILVYTPNEWKSLCENTEHRGFWKDVLLSLEKII